MFVTQKFATMFFIANVASKAACRCDAREKID
jgi:hypothetical protein